MADLEQMKLLKQGVEDWNAWRRENPRVRPKMSDADLSSTNLSRVDLSDADLADANLSRANLSGAFLNSTNLSRANMRDVDLRDALLNDADLRDVDLSDALLNDADLSGANLRGAFLSDANLSHADLSGAFLGSAFLGGAEVYRTVFANIDLRNTKGLTEIRHLGRSHVELYSVQLPQDGSALHFLRGAGVPDEWIDEYRVRMMHPIQYHSLFISYSSKDEMLATRLHADLQAAGVRCWFAPEDMKIGDRIRQRIDEAIHMQDKLLLLLSEHALPSNWVANEVEAALEKEDRQQREVLFPVRRTRHIGDFTHWTDPQAYQVAFDRLLRDLKQN